LPPPLHKGGNCGFLFTFGFYGWFRSRFLAFSPAFFINLALRLETIGLRKKDNSKVVKRPRMPEWIRFLLGILRLVYPEAAASGR